MEQGGIKEQMYAARTGYRREQDALLQRLWQENAAPRLRKKPERMAGRQRP
ncbi:hypothetical protein HMPREF9141_1370 [Prevotella multiformis DSM 16608]|uniref:Uncharacterized protein n=1 Tax=Prevotella multiformis DSM 16608 TaxID=888743 RepID=F0F703_9BACT|nr:hypothetical protein HMPREF9141_1370 [Prevotella multiformis DSM 16608]